MRQVEKKQEIALVVDFFSSVAVNHCMLETCPAGLGQRIDALLAVSRLYAADLRRVRNRSFYSLDHREISFHVAAVDAGRDMFHLFPFQRI